MAQSSTMTVRLERDIKQRLERLAQATRRSKSFLAAEAIEQWWAGAPGMQGGQLPG